MWDCLLRKIFLYEMFQSTGLICPAHKTWKASGFQPLLAQQNRIISPKFCIFSNIRLRKLPRFYHTLNIGFGKYLDQIEEVNEIVFMYNCAWASVSAVYMWQPLCRKKISPWVIILISLKNVMTPLLWKSEVIPLPMKKRRNNLFYHQIDSYISKSRFRMNRLDSWGPFKKLGPKYHRIFAWNITRKHKLGLEQRSEHTICHNHFMLKYMTPLKFFI